MAIVSDVVILARTHMKENRVCIGGYSLHENKYVRLLVKENIEQSKFTNRFGRVRKISYKSYNNNHLKNMNETEPYRVGEIYTIKYENRNDIVLPHCEDVVVLESSLKYRPNDYGEFLNFLPRIALSNMHIKNLFNKLLQWKNGSGFLIEQANLPSGSVMVVQLNHDLYLSKKDSDYYYYIDNNLGKTFKVKYVGVDDRSNVRKISAGVFLRFSLARWWDGNGQFQPKRAYLQLSAIY